MIRWEHEGDALSEPGIAVAWIHGPRVRLRTRRAMWYWRWRVMPPRMYFYREVAP